MAAQTKQDLLQRLTGALQGGETAEAQRLLCQCLAQWRPMDRAGAWLVLEGQEEFAALVRAGDPAALVEFTAELAERKACIICGTCCRASSPTLYLADLDLIGPDRIPQESLFTLRAGELAWSPRHKRLHSLDQELIKLAEDQTRACCFLAGNRCRIYEKRPLQCRNLQCWSQRHAGELEDHPRLTRREIFKDDEKALALINEYELKLPAAQASKALSDAAERGDSRLALSMLELDHRLRWGITRQYGYAQELLPLLLGRPLKDWLVSFGLKLELDEKQKPVLNRK